MLTLLKVIGLEQYEDVFRSECISGDLLLELNDDILEHEIGVTSRLHRLKLNGLISGKKSAKDILQPKNAS